MKPRRLRPSTSHRHSTAKNDHPPSGALWFDIQFEDRPDDIELGRLTESTVWVNRAHPAYRRAQASHSVGYHIALAVAMALAPLAVEAPRPAWLRQRISVTLGRSHR